jgi:hypothetical protein
MPANIRQGGNCLTETNTLPYYDAELVTAVKSFTAVTP